MRSTEQSLAVRVLAVTAFLSVSWLALRNPSKLWASATFTLAVVAVLTAVVAMVGTRGSVRGAWFGSALFGAVYLIISFGPFAWLNNEGLRPPPLLTEHSIRPLSALSAREDRWDGKIQLLVSPPVELQPQASDLSVSGTFFYVQTNVSPPRQIVHSLWTIVFAALGGLLARLTNASRLASD